MSGTTDVDVVVALTQRLQRELDALPALGIRPERQAGYLAIAVCDELSARGRISLPPADRIYAELGRSDRNRRIRAARRRGIDWLVLSERFGMSTRQLRRIVAGADEEDE